jgi:hypothetical protein
MRIICREDGSAAIPAGNFYLDLSVGTYSYTSLLIPVKTKGQRSLFYEQHLLRLYKSFARIAY